MDNTVTLKDEQGAYCKPKEETIRFILNYSKALEYKKLKSGIEIKLIRN